MNTAISCSRTKRFFLVGAESGTNNASSVCVCLHYCHIIPPQMVGGAFYHAGLIPQTPMIISDQGREIQLYSGQAVDYN